MSKFTAQIQYGDDYVQPLLLSALNSRLQSSSYDLVTSSTIVPEEATEKKLLQILQYEQLSFEVALTRPKTVLVNAYVIRKALIRKHFLAETVARWIAKRPSSILAQHVKMGVRLDVDYVEYLDEALADAYEVRDSIAANAILEPDQREWWILKPGMADGGNGIRLFSTEDELTSIFEEFEPDDDDENYDENDDDDEEEEEEAKSDEEVDGFVVTSKQSQQSQRQNVYASQLRHFIAQPYIHPPLLIDKRKFHIRTYVLAVGALKVYVSRPMLALFAAAEYQAPWESANLRAHLTNTCLQGSTQREGSVRAFWDLDDVIPGAKDHKSSDKSWKESVFSEICAMTGEVFEAAARNEMVHFQALPNAFELFGIDFMVDAHGTAWLLEVNAFPDFKQTGENLKVLLSCLWADVMELAVKPFFVPEAPVEEATMARMVKVLDIDLGRH